MALAEGLPHFRLSPRNIFYPLPVPQAWFPARRRWFFSGDAIPGVAVSLLGMKLRPSKHTFLLGCRITGTDSVSEALEGLCDGVLGVKRRSGSVS